MAFLQKMKSCSNTISEPLAKLINHSFATSTFPNRLKEAQVIPVYKKQDPSDKRNYRPISILQFIFKLYKKSINRLPIKHSFWEYVQPFPRCFQTGHGVSVQYTLLRLVEDWRKALESHEYYAAILMDLTRTYCLRGLTSSEVYPKALFWALLFSMFLLMIYFTFWINPLSTTMLMIIPNLMLTQTDTLIHTLQQDCTSPLQWFKINQMKTKPTKFQAVSFGKRG